MWCGLYSAVPYKKWWKCKSLFQNLERNLPVFLHLKWLSVGLLYVVFLILQYMQYISFVSQICALLLSWKNMIYLFHICWDNHVDIIIHIFGQCCGFELMPLHLLGMCCATWVKLQPCFSYFKTWSYAFCIFIPDLISLLILVVLLFLHDSTLQCVFVQKIVHFF
jgi:hypothetical protein